MKTFFMACSFVLLAVAVAGGQETPKDAAAYVKRADAYAAAGDFKRAYADYDKAIEIDPNNASALVRRAIAGIAEEDKDEAAHRGMMGPDYNYANRWNDLDAALKLDPKNTTALEVRGEQYLVIVQYGKALADFNAVIAMEPGNAAAFRGRGEAYAGSGETDKALADYGAAIHYDINNAQAYDDRAELYLRMANSERMNTTKDAQEKVKRDMDRAVADYGAAIRIKLAGVKDKKEFARDLATKAGADHEFAMAVACWGAVLEIDPKDADAWFQRAQEDDHVDAGDQELADYNEAIRLNPTNAEAREARAEISGDTKQSLEDYTAVLKMKPDAETYLERGSVYEEQESLEKAVADYSAAIRLAPENYAGYTSRGGLYERMGKLDEAIADYDSVIRILPEHPDAYFRRGYVWYRKKEWDKAIADLTKGIQFDLADNQDSPLEQLEPAEAAYVECAQAWVHKGMYDKAFADFDLVIGKDAEDSESRDAKAWLYATCAKAEIRDGAKAVPLAMQACELTRWEEASDIDTLAAAYAETGNWEKAVGYEKMAIKMAGDDRAVAIKTKGQEDTTASHDADDDAAAIQQYTARLALYQQDKPCRAEEKDDE